MGPEGEMEPPLNQAHLVSLLHWFSWDSDLMWILQTSQLSPNPLTPAPAQFPLHSCAICLATCPLSLEGGFAGNTVSSVPSPALGKTVFSPGVSPLMTSTHSHEAALECQEVLTENEETWASEPNQNQFFPNHKTEGDWKHPVIRHAHLPCCRSTLVWLYQPLD